MVSCNHTVDYERLLLSVPFVNCTSLEVKGSPFWEGAVMGCAFFSLVRTGFNRVSSFNFLQEWKRLNCSIRAVHARSS